MRTEQTTRGPALLFPGFLGSLFESYLAYWFPYSLFDRSPKSRRLQFGSGFTALVT